MKASITQLFAEDNKIVMGDANAHIPLMYSDIAKDNRGVSLGAENTSSDCILMNDHIQTPSPFGNSSSSSPG